MKHVLTIEEALDQNETQTILKELYSEVTVMADAIWSRDIVPQPGIWKKVRSSPWYKTNFSELDLKPLAVFFEIIENVEKEGIAKDQLHDYLQKCSFAQTLLALRELFQRNGC